MKNLIIIFLLGLLSSCTDKTNFKDVAKASLAALFKNDTTNLKEFFAHNMDNMQQEQKKEIFMEMLKFKDKSYSFLMTDTGFTYVNPSIATAFDKSTYYIESYFKIDTNYYSLNADFFRDKKGRIVLTSLGTFNLTEACYSGLLDAYRPVDEIEVENGFKSLQWKIDYKKRTFKSGAVLLENLSKKDLDYIKFRVTLKHNGNSFFKQTVVHREKIFSGDIVAIDIPGLSDFYVGFPITENNFQFQAELIDMSPKSEDPVCKKLAELKAIKK